MQSFKTLYPEMKVTGYCDQYAKKPDRSEIDVSLKRPAKRLGKNLSNDLILHRSGQPESAEPDHKYPEISCGPLRAAGSLYISLDE